MTTKTKTKTKTKIKDSLKNVFINELKDQKEIERLERVKANADLKSVLIYTDKNQPQNKQFIDTLTQEGIKFKEIDITENKDDWNKVTSITNLGLFILKSFFNVLFKFLILLITKSFFLKNL